METTLNLTYSPTVFESLPEFRRAKENLEVFRRRLIDLGDVICAYELHEVFGVNLLHKHFDLFENEQMIKSRDIEINEARVVPSEIDEERKAYFFKPTMSGDSFVYRPLEFFKLGQEPSGLPNIEQIFEQHQEFFGQFASRLYELELSNVFGLALLHDEYLEVGPDDLKVETTDESARVLTIQVENRSTLPMEEITQTLWFFTPPPDCNLGTDSVSAPSTCIGHCKDHCQQHCTTHCNAHCEDHCKSHCSQHCKDH